MTPSITCRLAQQYCVLGVLYTAFQLPVTREKTLKMQRNQNNSSQPSTFSTDGESPTSNLAAGGSPTSSPAAREQQKDSVWLIGDSRVTVRPGKRVDVEKLYPVSRCSVLE